MSDRGFAPRLVERIRIPGGAPVLGEAVTADGRYLLAATGSGAAVISIAAAIAGRPEPVLGMLKVPGSDSFAERSAVEVAISPDDQFVFVTREFAGDLAVFDLREAMKRQFRGSGLVGTIPLGQGPVGMDLSPDGRRLYITSEMQPGAGQTEPGTLSVIDRRLAERRPDDAMLGTVPAGCSPVRVQVSADGRIVWVTARGSNAVLGLSAARLLEEPKRAIVANVRTGPAPVGLLLAAHGRRMLVANSNRFAGPGQPSTIDVVDTRRALAGKPALVGSIPTGSFPRELWLVPGGRIALATNYASSELESINLAQLP